MIWILPQPLDEIQRKTPRSSQTVDPFERIPRAAEMLENLDLFNFLDFLTSGFMVVDIGELCPELIPEELVSESVA